MIWVSDRYLGRKTSIQNTYKPSELVSLSYFGGFSAIHAPSFSSSVIHEVGRFNMIPASFSSSVVLYNGRTCSKICYASILTREVEVWVAQTTKKNCCLENAEENFAF